MIKGNKIIVKTGEYSVSDNCNVLITHGLGSCVAVTIHDEENKIGGMLHYLLPESPNKEKKSKYADTGLDLLLARLLELGVNREKLKAKLFGGAMMFGDFIKDKSKSVGGRNIKKAREVLGGYGIPIIGEDVGGNYGRSVEFDIATGIAKINSYIKREKSI